MNLENLVTSDWGLSNLVYSEGPWIQHHQLVIHFLLCSRYLPIATDVTKIIARKLYDSALNLSKAVVLNIPKEQAVTSSSFDLDEKGYEGFTGFKNVFELSAHGLVCSKTNTIHPIIQLFNNRKGYFLKT